MIDVSGKFDTLREATAEAVVTATKETLARCADGRVPKGDLRAFAEAAGLLAAKRTPELIPHCHPVPLDSVEVTVECRPDAVVVTATVKAVWKTGVEMEAMTAAAAGALTVYDLLKFAKDDTLTIAGVRLVKSQGATRTGRSRRPGSPPASSSSRRPRHKEPERISPGSGSRTG